ncbi:MAG: NfeD family protein [Oscillospiraceae bacterium]
MLTFIWLALVVVFILVEAATVSVVSTWFAIGAAAAMVTSFFTGNIWIQIAVFVAVSGLMLLLLRPLVNKYVTPHRTATNADRLLGMEGTVTEDIAGSQGKGQITVAGAVWTARSEDGTPIPADTHVRVLRIEGVTAVVTPSEQTAEGK